MLQKKHYANGQDVYRIVGEILTYFYKSGKIKAEGMFINDQMQGEWRFFRETGQLMQIGHFKNDQKHGEWTRYDSNDKVVYQETFKDNKPVKK